MKEGLKIKKMTKAGLDPPDHSPPRRVLAGKIEEAKTNGKWTEAYTSHLPAMPTAGKRQAGKKLPLPSDLKDALMKNKKA